MSTSNRRGMQFAPAVTVLLYLLLWTAIGAAASLSFLGVRSHWTQTLRIALAHWWGWGLLTGPLLAANARVSRLIPEYRKRLLWLLPLGILFSAFEEIVSAVLRVLLGVSAWRSILTLETATDAIRELFWCLLVFSLIIAVVERERFRKSYLDAELRSARLQKVSAEARLLALRSQLNPHFLFNALNTISAYVDTDAEMTRQMLEHLGSMLRSSLDVRTQSEITLAEEFALLDQYLAIQKVRFGPRLRVNVDVSPVLMSTCLPTLILQPLVENSIRHGIGVRAKGGTISITAKRAGDDMRVTVSDDGVGLPHDWSSSSFGTGLSITRERIATMYPGRGELYLSARAGGGTEAVLLWPFHNGDSNNAIQ